MTAAPFEQTEDVRAALREIVAEYGPAALSDPSTLSNLLKDLLPDAPGVARLLVATAEDRLADTLRDHLAQGMDATTATRLAASAFASVTVFTPEVCTWVTGEIAAVLGMTSDVLEVQAAGVPAAVPVPSAEAGTISAPEDARAALAPEAAAPHGALPVGAETIGPQAETIGSQDVATRIVSDTDGHGSKATAQGPGHSVAAWFATRRPVAAVVAAIAVLVLAGGIFAWAPWRSSQPPAVLRPAGLSIEHATFSSVSLSWSGPAQGPRPGSYEIYQDGSPIGSVGGAVTAYHVDGLAPGTAYRFQLRAIKGRRHSVLSASLIASTDAAPPVSAAELTGTWTVRYSHVHWSGLTSAPSLRTDSWTFSPQCSSGPCSVQLSGAAEDIPFRVTLHRSGGVYAGTATMKGYFRCSSVHEVGAVAVRLRISQASAAGDVWQASSWTGQMTLTVPAGACTASEVTATVSSSG